jgi:hypothetical protein
MIERPIGFALLAAPFAWVAAELLPSFPGGQVAVGAAAATCFVVAGLALERTSWLNLFNVGLVLALLVIAVTTFADPAPFGAAGPEITAGVIIGIPWIVVGYVARPEEPLVIRFIAYGGAVTWGLLLIADGQQLSGLSGASAATQFVNGFFSIAGQQGQVFGGLLSGSPSPPLPLNHVFDAGYAVLTGVSLVGLLLVLARPQTGTQTPLPVAVRSFRESEGDRELPTTYGFTSPQLEVFRERSSSEPPLLTWPPGLEPVFYGAVATGLFLTMAYFAPTWAVLVATTALALGVLILVRNTEVPPPLREPRRLRRRAPAPPAKPESTDAAELPSGTEPTGGEPAAASSAGQP